MCCATISDETLSYFLITLVERGLENHSLIYDSITSLEVSTQLDVEWRQWYLTWYSMTFFAFLRSRFLSLCVTAPSQECTRQAQEKMKAMHCVLYIWENGSDACSEMADRIYENPGPSSSDQNSPTEGFRAYSNKRRAWTLPRSSQNTHRRYLWV